MTRRRPADQQPDGLYRVNAAGLSSERRRTHTLERGSCNANGSVCACASENLLPHTNTHAHKGNLIPGRCSSVCTLLMTTCSCAGQNNITPSAQVLFCFRRKWRALCSFSMCNLFSTCRTAAVCFNSLYRLRSCQALLYAP